MTLLAILKDVLAALLSGLKSIAQTLFLKLQNWFISKALAAQKGQVSSDTIKANDDAADFLSQYDKYKADGSAVPQPVPGSEPKK